MSLSFNPLKFRLPQRATLSLQVANPLGAADLLMHSNNNLRGWGQFAFPDPTLLAVRGFDPQTQRYKYDVNQRFGSTIPAFTAVRAPVTCLLYTSDAADDLLCVDLGGRRIIKT